MRQESNVGKRKWKIGKVIKLSKNQSGIEGLSPFFTLLSHPITLFSFVLYHPIILYYFPFLWRCASLPGLLLSILTLVVTYIVVDA